MNIKAKRLYYRYKVNENSSQSSHVFSKIVLNHDWKNFQAEQPVLKSFLRDPLVPNGGVLDMEVFEVDSGKVILSTVPIFSVKKVYSHSELLLKKREELADICTDLRINHKFSTKDVLVDKILKFQNDHIDSKKFVINKGKRLSTNKNGENAEDAGELPKG